MTLRKPGAGGLVYSTEGGRMCPVCRHPVAQCVCRAPAGPAKARDGVVRVSRESKGRGGKTVTLIRGAGLEADALAALGKRLRTLCGAGGTARDGVIEVQGDHCERVLEWLTQQGWAAKRAG